MSRILIVSANLKDWSKDSGGKERTATLAEALTNHEVTFLSFVWEGPSFEKKISEHIYQIQPPVELSVANQYRKLIRNNAKQNHDAVFHVLKDNLIEFNKTLKSLSKNSDLIIVDHMSVAPLVEGIKNVPIVYNSHNAEITMANQLYPENQALVKIVEKVERTIIKQSVAVTYCSTRDFQELEDHYGAINNSFYVPNGTVMHEKINSDSRQKSKNILFVGSSHPPNVVAAKKLIELAKTLPDYNFIVCGGASNSLKKEILPNNLQALGHIPDEDLDQLFKESFAFINPMESGSGTHLKIMKALSYGIPIITSEIGARGFSNNEISECFMIADTIKDMHNAVKYIEDKNIYASLCSNGYELSKIFDWEKIKADYANFIESIISMTPIKENNEIVRADGDIRNKTKVLVYSIIRNREQHMDAYYDQIKSFIKFCPEYEFYLSIYENDSEDQTRRELMNKDWSMFAGISIVSENIKTKYFESVKDAERVENLAKARNKGIVGGGFIDKVDYVLMIEGDVYYSPEDVKNLLTFRDKEPDFDIVSSVSLRKNGTHYDWWATRTSHKYVQGRSELDAQFKKKDYGKYYSTSNGLCLYRAKAFQDGVRHHWINTVSKEFDCEMVVLCQNFQNAGYKNIFINYKSIAHHK
jgi:glycosyltransferase involved in cell wall biosynthesis